MIFSFAPLTLEGVGCRVVTCCNSASDSWERPRFVSYHGPHWLGACESRTNCPERLAGSGCFFFFCLMLNCEINTTWRVPYHLPHKIIWLQEHLHVFCSALPLLVHGRCSGLWKWRKLLMATQSDSQNRRVTQEAPFFLTETLHCCSWMSAVGWVRKEAFAANLASSQGRSLLSITAWFRMFEPFGYMLQLFNIEIQVSKLETKTMNALIVIDVDAKELDLPAVASLAW